MTQGDRHERKPYDPALLAMESERHCEQPPHAWVEPMKSAEPRNRNQWPVLDGRRRVSHRFLSRIAVGVRRAVAAFEPHLVGTVWGRPPHKEPGIEGDAAVRIGVELHHPTLDTVGIELRVNGTVERIGKVDAFAVTADLDHLRSAAQCAVFGAGMRGPRDDAPDPHLT